MRYLLLLIALTLSHKVNAAACSGSILNPVTEVNWQCIMPVRIGGVATVNSSAPPDPETIGNPICTCMDPLNPRIGLKVSFWEPVRIIEVVTDPYCFPSLGFRAGAPTALQGGGIVTDDTGQTKLFAQAHWIAFPAWAIIDMFTDIPCLDAPSATSVAGMAIDAMTEVNPLWNNDIAALLFNPEAVLFANPAAALSCIADSVAANVSGPLDTLFWCMGSWGNTYPLAGSITEGGDMVEAAAGLAARRMYFAAREGAATGGALGLEDTAVDYCSTHYTPIWNKSHYRLQLAKPIKDFSCRQIGVDGLRWSYAKNPIGNGDNFAFIMFRKNKCCVSN